MYRERLRYFARIWKHASSKATIPNLADEKHPFIHTGGDAEKSRFPPGSGVAVHNQISAATILKARHLR